MFRQYNNHPKLLFKVQKKKCFTVKRKLINRVLVTVYDGNGYSATKQLSREAARKYIDSLYNSGFLNFDEVGEYI